MPKMYIVKTISQVLVAAYLSVLGEPMSPASASPPIQNCTSDDTNKLASWLVDLSVTDAWLLKEQCRVELKRSPLDPQILYVYAITLISTGESARGRSLLESLRDVIPQVSADIAGLDVRAANGEADIAKSTGNLRQLVQYGVPKAKYVLATLIAEGEVDPSSENELTDLLSDDLAAGKELSDNLVAEAIMNNITVQKNYAVAAQGRLAQCAAKSVRCAYQYIQVSRRIGVPIDRALLLQNERPVSFSRDPREIYWLAYLLEENWITFRSSDANIFLYSASAEAGNSDAFMRLAHLAYNCSVSLDDITGRKKDALNLRCDEAAAWLLEKSSGGNGYAQMTIGKAYLITSASDLFRRDNDEAKYWLERAMQNGFPEAFLYVPDSGEISQ